MPGINYDAKISSYKTHFNFTRNETVIILTPENARFGETLVTIIRIYFEKNVTEDRVKYYQYDPVRDVNDFEGVLEITCNESKYYPILDFLKNTERPYVKVYFKTPHYETETQGGNTYLLFKVIHCYLSP